MSILTPLLTIPIVIQLIAGPFVCADVQTAGGCFNKDTHTIQIDYTLPGDQFKYVMLHEIGHAKFNDDPEISQSGDWPVFNEANADRPEEKMADWFTAFLNMPGVVAHYLPDIYNWFKARLN